MNDDEKRLLLAVAACLLAEKTGKGPSKASQVKVLRRFLLPFRDFMRADVAENLRRQQDGDDAEDYRSSEDAWKH
jgi:hypothetical protein